MRFFEKAKGAVSIFLVIILVPMMTISSTFVDAGKVKLGSAMAESAGDLALNTALTNYDMDLKELYGLMATAQDTSDLFLKLEDYYTNSLISAGVSEEYSAYYVEQFMSSLGRVSETNDVSDIMNMEVVDFAVNKLDDANLANASIMKKQIVDFMKYRAPINMGISFLSALKSFSTLNKQTDLVDKKQEYYEKQQSLMETLKAAWGAISEYNNTDVAKVDGYVKTVSDNMAAFADGRDVGDTTYSGYFSTKADGDGKPKGLSYLVIWDLYDTLTYLGDDQFIYHVTYDTIAYKSPGNGAQAETNTDEYYNYPKIAYQDPNSANPTLKFKPVETFADYCQEYVKGRALPTKEDFISQLSGFYSALSGADSYLADLNDYIDDYENENRYDLRYYYYAMKKSLVSYAKNLIKLYTSYQKIKAMEIWVKEYDNQNETDEEGNTITSDYILEEETKLNENSYKTGSKSIRSWCDSAEEDFNKAIDTFKPIADKFNKLAEKTQTTYNTSDNIATNELSLISSEAAKYKAQFESAKTHLENAIKYLNDAKEMLGDEGEVTKAKAQWNQAATDGAIQDTSLAKQNKAEIDQLDKYLNVENIDKLIKRLSNVLDSVSDNLTELEKYQYGGTYFGEINTVETLCKIYGEIDGSAFSTLSPTMGELNGHTGTWIANNCSKGTIKYDWVGTPSHQPNLNLDKTSLYSYLCSHFAIADDPTSVKQEDETNGRGFYKNIKETSKNTAEEKSKPGKEPSEGEKGKDNEKDPKAEEISNMSNLPSKLQNNKGGNNKDDTPSGDIETDVDKGAGAATSSLSKLFGKGFLNAIAGFAEDLRDKLYITEYIIDMFSYDTIEKEYIQEHDVEAVSAGDLQTLTKCNISAQNNYAYGNEVEYIIYGGTYSENKVKAYASIFGIRFGFNVVYAFATSEIRDSALAIATPISAATLGIIPVPLIQAVIIIGIACCESAIDLDALSQGYKVPLYKNKTTWRCSISGLTKYAKDKAKEKAAEVFKDVSEAVIDKSIDRLNEVLDKTSDEINANLKECGEGAITAFTSVFTDVITENADIAIQQLTTYINTAVESTMCLDAGEDHDAKRTAMIDWVKQEISAWGAQFTGNDLVSMVKREAANIIVSNSDMCINELFDLVEKSIKNSDYGAEIKNILDESSTKDGIDQLGGVVRKQIDAIRQKITQKIMDATSKVSEYMNQATEDIKNAAAQGADELKKSINSHIDGVFGSGEHSIGNQDGNEIGAAAFFSFGYSDYLKLFLLIGTFTNEEKILLRTADVIQVNMSKCISKDANYLLSNAAVYVKIDAELQVKPTLLALPLFAKVEKNPVSNANWYTIKYSGIAGY